MPHALLIDGENPSSRHADHIRDEVPDDCADRQVFGDTARLNGWMAVPWLTPVHVAPCKNAADIALAVEAMDLALSRGFSGFTICTSDSGLANLAARLRGLGRSVTLLGEAKALPVLRATPHRFAELPPLSEPVAALPPPSQVAALPPAPVIATKGLTKLESFILGMISAAGKGGVTLVPINTAVDQGPKIKIASTPERSWHAWLRARPHLFALEPRGPDARVRLAAP